MLDENLRVNVSVFWVVTLCVLVYRYKLFKLHLASIFRVDLFGIEISAALDEDLRVSVWLLGYDAVFLLTDTDVSKGHVASIFRVQLCSKDSAI
jgi:hypothetical protein